MRELLKGQEYSVKDGRVYSSKHRVSFYIPDAGFGWSGRMTSNRTLQFFSHEYDIRLNIYLKLNISAKLWVDSELYHLDQRLNPVDDLVGKENNFQKSFKYKGIEGYKFAMVGPDEQEVGIEITGPSKMLTVAAFEIWSTWLDFLVFLPRKVKRPDNISWLHVFCFLCSACIYADDDVTQDELNVMIERLKGWWGSPPTKEEFMKIVDECNEWFKQAKLAPYLMDDELDFLLKALNKQEWFDQSDRNKFVKDLAAMISVDQKVTDGEKRYFKKVADALGL